MNKWQKVISQIVRDDECIMTGNYKQNRVYIRESIKQHSFTFEKLVDFKQLE